MQKQALLLLITGVLVLSIDSCKKNNPEGKAPTVEGVYVINQGNYGFGNGEVSFYNPANNQVTNNLFNSVNGFHPGDVLQSMYILDTLGFIVVNNSQRVLEVKIPSFKCIRTITIPNSSPRFFLPINDSLAYVTELYQGEVHVVNYLTGAVVNEITGVAIWTEHMLAVGNNVIVEEDNSLTVPGSVDSLAIINTVNNSVQQFTFPGGGVQGIVKDYLNRVWMASTEDSVNGIPAALYCLSSNLSVIKKLQFPMGHNPNNLCMDGAGTELYFFDTGLYNLSVNDTTVPTLAFANGGTHNFYGLGVNPVNGDVYAADALDYVQNSVIYRYGSSGNLITSFTAGIITGNFTFNVQ